MILYGYSKHGRVLMPSSEQQFLKLDAEHESFVQQGLPKERIKMRMKGYWEWESLKDMREDFLFFHNRDDVLSWCHEKKEGYVLVINIPDDAFSDIAHEEHIQQEGNDVMCYRIPAGAIGRLDAPKTEFFPLAGLREHEDRKREAQEEEYGTTTGKESFFSKLDRLFHR